MEHISKPELERHPRKTGDWRRYAYKRITLRDGEQCCRCGYETKLCLDHTIALCDGGTNQDDNLQLLCTFCHKKKTAEEIAARAFRRWQNSGLSGYAQVLL